ncbi:MAG: GPP34 family phosphoprotein [Henriciella sp.]|jgi:hypothetical protein
MTTALSLPQALLLLTLKDETGKPKAGFYKPAIAGAAISELLLQDMVTLIDEKKPKLNVRPEATSDSLLLTMCIDRMRDSKKPRDMAHWVMKLGQHKDLVPTLGNELCGLGALSKETSKVFGLFDRTVWPQASPKLEMNLKIQLEDAMFGTAPVDERTCAIIALAESADVLRHNFDRQKLKANKDRIKAITAGDLYAAGATAKAIKAAQAAIIAATSAAVAASAASS